MTYASKQCALWANLHVPSVMPVTNIMTLTNVGQEDQNSKMKRFTNECIKSMLHAETSQSIRPSPEFHLRHHSKDPKYKIEHGGRPQLKSMAISYLKDQDDQQQFELQYRSVQNSADIETVLDEVSDDLKKALDKDELVVQPKLAVLEVSSIPADSNDNRGPEDAMRVADYSVYNEQVNF
jgi:hypothetical protein